MPSLRMSHAAAATVLLAGVMVSQPAAARVGIRPGPNNHAEFFTIETGQRFVPRGVNYTRLGIDFPGNPKKESYHVLFCPSQYSPALASAALEEIRASGYNVARVFLTPQCMTMDMPRWTLNATVVSYVANFLWNADRVGIKVVLTIDTYLPPGYTPTDDESPIPNNLGRNNDGLLRPEYVSARARFWADLLVMLESQSRNITNALLAIDIANEPAFYATPAPRGATGPAPGAPFDVMGRSYHDFDRDFNMASPADRQLLADMAFARYVSWTRGQIARVAPAVLVTVGMTPPFEVKLPGYNGLDLSQLSPGRAPGEFRYPARLKAAEPFLDYYSIHSYPGGMSMLEYLNRSLASIEYSSLDLFHRPIDLGELGSSRSVTPAIDQAAGNLSQYVSLLDQLAFAGYTMWTWDLFEQPQFWNMKDGGGAINAAVAPVARGYGTGGLAAGFYLVQSVAVIFHNGSNAACTYSTWEDFTDSTGMTSVAGLPNVLGAGAVRMTTCPLIARTGPFQHLNNLYYSNGDTAYCRFATWQDYMNMTGLPTAPQSVLHRLPDMRYDNFCHR